MVSRLVKRVAIVTGSASGIGLATARLATERGWAVVGIDVARERPDEEVVRASGGAALHADVSSPDAVEAVVAEAAGIGPLQRG